MKTLRPHLLLGALLLISCGPALADDAATVASVADDYWLHLLERSPALRIKEGLPVDDLPDLSYEAGAADAAAAEAMLARLEPVDPGSLDEEDRLTLEILRWELEQTRDGLPHFWHRFQLTPYTFSFSGIDSILRQLPLKSEEDVERYLRLAGQLGDVVAQLEWNLQHRRELGILIPQAELPAVIGLLQAHSGEGEASPFWVADGRLARLRPATVEAFRKRLRAEIATTVAPAFEHLLGRLDEGYREAAPERVGLQQYPGGDEAYRWLVGYHTTLDVTPEEVHLAGLAAVEALEARMVALRRELGLPADRVAAHAVLRTHPKALAESPDEVRRRLMEPLSRIEPLLDDYFATTPEAPYGVERLDPKLEGSMTFGYYEWPTPQNPTGRYLYNASKLDQRPLLNAAALIYHELVPGHHFQIALQSENEALPSFRRNFFTTAFVEGWAEYASSLGEEMGLYDDPWDRYGRLTMDLFLAVRLVVDTGMNDLGWTREMATRYMEDRLLESETQIATETLRYAVDMPGQALAYKMGSLTIWKLRRRAEEALGPVFDIRAFHDEVIGHGAMPMSVLEGHVDRWIARVRSQQPTSSARLAAGSPQALDADAASRFAELALACAHTEYPNKIAHVLQSDEDVSPPRELTPAFYGCYDWHSSVHGHWLLARLARLFPEASFAGPAREALERSLTPENIVGEVRYLEGEGRVSFERPYGLAWLLQLSAELREWNDPDARRWAEALAPLESVARERLADWLPKLAYPIRIGEHAQTAFAFGLALDWARSTGDDEMASLLEETTRRLYLADRSCPLGYEPSGQDFLSPCLAEADLVRRVLPPDGFASWLGGFLPEIPAAATADWLPVGVVTDRSDPKLAHLDGLNLSRAWMLEGIASGLPAPDPRRQALDAAAAAHREAALPHVTGEHYEGGHWLGSFAVYLVTGRGL